MCISNFKKSICAYSTLILMKLETQANGTIQYTFNTGDTLHTLLKEKNLRLLAYL